MSEPDGGAREYAPPTVLDPGRQRRPREQGLPPELAERFDIVQVLRGEESEAEVFLATERATGETRVLRLFPETRGDQRVTEFLLADRTRHIVKVFERAVEPRYGYEVMEHIPGGDLLELRRLHPAGLDAERLTALVGQVAEALAELHAARLVHRDVKPANLVLRRLEPFEVALIDFGLCEYRAGPEVTADRSGTARFMPREFVAGGLVSPGFDWWSLGMTVLELATGHEWMEGLAPELVPAQLSEGPVHVDDVADPRIQLLCRGLLAHSRAARWGADEVRRWLAGGSPEVAAESELPREVPEPFTCFDTDHFRRAGLALTLTMRWESAADLLFGHGRDPIRRLSYWARQYPDLDDGLKPGRGPASVRLLRVLRQLAPHLPPIYRGHAISIGTLPEYAREAVAGVGAMAELIEELFEFELLAPLAVGAADPELGLDGGDRLDEVDAEWRAGYARLRAVIDTIEDQGARQLLDQRDQAGRRRVLALALWATATDDEARAEAYRRVQAHARVMRLPWYTRLAGDPVGMWAAYLLRGYAREQAEELSRAERAREEYEIWLARHEALLEWLRRQSRPQALGWAAAGISVLTALCAGMVGAGDLAHRVPVSTVTDAWTVTVFSVAASLATESVLAWEAASRYHPRYSLPGAALIALSRAARTPVRRRVIAAACTAGLGVAYLLGAFVPVAPPLLLGVAVPPWAVYRLTTWYADRREERAAVRRGVQAATARAALPVAPDPVGAQP